MKHDYDKMGTDEIDRIYLRMFGEDFAVEWDDELEPHRQETIDCIESGKPQDMGKLGNYGLPDGAVA